MKSNYLKLTKTNSNIYYECSEIISSDKKTVLFIHGFEADFNAQINLDNFFAQKYNFYKIHLPGHGKSIANNIDDFNVDYYAKIIFEFIKEMNIVDYTIIGHSMGGAIVGHLFEQYNIQPKQTILIAPVNKTINNIKAQLLKQFLPPNLNKPEDIAKLMINKLQSLNNLYTNKINVDNNKTFDSKTLYAKGLGILGLSLFNEKLNLIAENGYKKIHAPAILYYGSLDNVIDNQNIAKYFESINKEIEICKLDSFSHSPWLDNFEEFTKIIADWIDKN